MDVPRVFMEGGVMGSVSVSIVLLLSLAAAGAAPATDEGGEESGTSSTLEFSVLGMHCESCAEAAEKALAEAPGVLAAVVDFEQRHAEVRTNGDVTPGDVRDALGALGFEARFGNEELASDPLPEEIRSLLDVQTVARGERIKLKQHLAPGKITIFDYYADWCGPCHLLGPKLERLALRYENVAVRKVDIVDYESEAAKQATRDFRLPGLPYTRVFDEDGKLLGEVQGNRIEAIEKVVAPHARERERPLESS